MKKTLITIAFATASMFAAQNPAPTAPAAGTTDSTKPAAVKTKKHSKVKKAKKTTAPAPASK